jgi:flagellar L-ring protein FlgH
MKALLLSVLTLCCLAVNFPAHADNLFRPGNWPALAADRRASAPGDVLTVLVYENATASNSASSGSTKAARLNGGLVAGTRIDEAGSLNANGATDSRGSNSRSGKMVAQISVTVDQILPNGDLRVSGAQRLKIGSERSLIRVRGRVRSADISPQNTILSSRLAEAEIDYDGKGFVSRSGKPGIVSRVFRWLGLM